MSEPRPLPDTAFDRRNDSQQEAGPDGPPSTVTAPVSLHDLPGEDTGPTVRPDSPEQPPTGTAGRNLLYGEIARGGMGAVLKGRDPLLGRDLAVKVLLEAHRDNPELVARFLEEAQIGGQLQHPGVVPVYELGRFDDHRPFFTMKLVKGQTLDALLKQRAGSRDNLTRFLTVFEQVCQTVAYAHARGVIHRDLKPSNVMVGAFGEVQVMDWGLAKVLSRGGPSDGNPPPAPGVTHIRTVPAGATPLEQRVGTLYGMGTFGYMPPEQALGEADQIDERADVFALGAILCVILTGQPPYVGDADELRRQSARGDLAGALSRLDESGADTELLGLCMECLAADLKARPRDAGVVARLIGDYQTGVRERLRQAELHRVAAQARAEEEAKARVLAEQVADAERAKALHERKARRLTLALAASVLLTVLLGGSGGLWFKHQADARAADRMRRSDEVRQGVELAVREAEAHQQQARILFGDPDRCKGTLAAARLAARQAERLATVDEAPEQLAGQVAALLAGLGEDEKDLKMVLSLEQVRSLGRSLKDDEIDYKAADAAYQQAFRDYGLDHEKLTPAMAAELIQQRPIKDELLVGLHDSGLMRYAITKSIEDPWSKWITEAETIIDPQAVLLFGRVIEEHERQLRDGAPEIHVIPHKQMFASQSRLQRLSLASAYRETGNFGALEALLRYEQEVRPQDFVANDRLAFFLTHQAKPTRLDEAARLYTAALVLRPQEEYSHYLLAFTLLQLREDHRAEDVCRKALRLNSKSSQTHLLLGTALLHQTRYAEAVSSYQEAVSLKPDRAYYHFALSGAQLACDKRASALASLSEAVRLAPQDATYRRFLADLLRDEKKFEEAIAEYRAAILLKEDDDASYFGLGILFEQQGKKADALEAFRKAAFLKPDEGSYHESLGRLFLNDEKWDCTFP